MKLVQEYVEVIVSVVGILGSVTAYLSHRYRTKQKTQPSTIRKIYLSRTRKVITGEEAIQFELDNWSWEHKLVGRVHILSIKNGGSLLQVGTPKRLTILWETVEGVRPVKMDYQDYICADEYVDKLRSSVKSKDLYETINVNDLITKQLKGANIAVGTRSSIVVPLTERPLKSPIETLFLSVNFKDSYEISPESIAHAQVLANRIRHLLVD